MADNFADVPTISPYQEFKNERILATAKALNERKMETGQVFDHGNNACAASISAIVETTTGERWRNASVPNIHDGFKTHKTATHVGEQSYAGKGSFETNHVGKGDIAFFEDDGTPKQHHIGIVSETANGRVTHVYSNSSSRGKFDNTYADGRDGNPYGTKHVETGSQYYRLPANVHEVNYMLNNVPTMGDKVELTNGFGVHTTHGIERAIDVPKLERGKPVGGWEMPGLTQTKDGSLTPESYFKDLTLREAMYQAGHGKVLSLEPKPGEHFPEMTALQKETMERAIASHLPPGNLQDRYMEKHNLGHPTSSELLKDVGHLEPKTLAGAMSRLQLGVVHAKEGKFDVPEFTPNEHLTAAQAEKLNATLHDLTKGKEIAPPAKEPVVPGETTLNDAKGPAVASNGTPIRQAPPNFTYAGQVDSVDHTAGTFVVVGGRNGNQAFEVRAEAAGGQLPDNGDRIRVRPGGIEQIDQTQSRALAQAR